MRVRRNRGGTLKRHPEKWRENMTIQKKYDVQKIYDRIQAGEKLTKKEDKELEEYENKHTDTEFHIIIGLNREMTESEKRYPLQK